MNDKHSILEALISSNNNVWGEFHMHPLKTNMRLATAAAARALGGLLSQEEEEQLQYADMLIDVSKIATHFGVRSYKKRMRIFPN